MGAGLSSTHGIAAFPNGEVYRVDDSNPKTNLSRLFVQQDFELGGEKEKLKMIWISLKERETLIDLRWWRENSV